MRVYGWISRVVWLIFVFYQFDFCQCDDNYPTNTGQQKTYRSALEKALQGAIGVVGFLTRPFFSTEKSSMKSNDDGFGSILNRFKDQVHAIVPGTRWCGDGDIAKNDEDIGLFRRTDACCRQHDKCGFNIEGGKSFENLKNDGLFTRSACECDQAFYDCLKEVRSPLSYDIGFTYFTILGPQCINYDYPIVSCTMRGGKRLIMRKCISYEYDMSQPMTFQWKDNPDF